jgi:hypothetical protein
MMLLEISLSQTLYVITINRQLLDQLHIRVVHRFALHALNAQDFSHDRIRACLGNQEISNHSIFLPIAIDPSNVLFMNPWGSVPLAEDGG